MYDLRMLQEAKKVISRIGGKALLSGSHACHRFCFRLLPRLAPAALLLRSKTAGVEASRKHGATRRAEDLQRFTSA